jgi:hypothetical protein
LRPGFNVKWFGPPRMVNVARRFKPGPCCPPHSPCSFHAEPALADVPRTTHPSDLSPLPCLPRKTNRDRGRPQKWDATAPLEVPDHAVCCNAIGYDQHEASCPGNERDLKNTVPIPRSASAFGVECTAETAFIFRDDYERHAHHTGKIPPKWRAWYRARRPNVSLAESGAIRQRQP